MIGAVNSRRLIRQQKMHRFQISYVGRHNRYQLTKAVWMTAKASASNYGHTGLGGSSLSLSFYVNYTLNTAASNYHTHSTGNNSTSLHHVAFKNTCIVNLSNNSSLSAYSECFHQPCNHIISSLM